jgi:hypothetical protein
MDALITLFKEILHLGDGLIAPSLVLLLVVLIRTFQINRTLRTDPPVPDLAYELELAWRVIRDKWVISAGCMALLCMLAYQLAVYPLQYVGSVVSRMSLRYVVPYAAPLVITVLIIWVSRRRKWARGVIVAVILLSGLWVYAYWRWIFPVRPTPPQKIGMWITSLAGQQNDRRYLNVFEGLKKHAWKSPVYVDELRETVPRTSMEKQIDQAQELSLRVGATGVLWMELGDKDEFLYATIHQSRTADNWDLPPVDLLDFSLVSHSPEMILQFLSGVGYLEQGRYDLSVQHFKNIQGTQLLPWMKTFVAYAYLARGRQGDPTDLPVAIQSLKSFELQHHNNQEVRGEANFLLGQIYAYVLSVEKKDNYQRREKALQASEQAFQSALIDFPEEKFPTQRGRVLLALGRALVDPDVLFGDFEDRSHRGQSALEQALELLKGKDTQIEYGRAKWYLGLALENQAMLATNGVKESLSSKAIQNEEGALQIFHKNKYPKEYAFIEDTIAVSYANLIELEPQPNSRKALDAYLEERDAAQQFGLQDALQRAEKGVCIVANEFDEPTVLLDGENSCEHMRKALQGVDPIGYCSVTTGLGEIYEKIATVRLVGINPLKYLRSAHRGYVESLATVEALPQKPFVLNSEAVLRQKIQEVNVKIDEALHH